MAKEEPQEPDLGEYTDYLILSSSDFTQGWRHNIMRLAPAASSDTTDVRHWTEAKLNRRDMQRVRREEWEIARQAADNARAEEEAAAARERGEVPNGAEGQVELKPGMPGYMAAQIKKEEEQRDDSKVAPAVGAAAGAKRPRRGFGAPKKTRRIFVTEGSSKERRLRFEERHPWVLETEDDKKPPNETRWIGKMDSSTSAAAGEGSSYICLILDPHSQGSEAAFKVVPANRWYKFASRPKYHMLTADEAEEEFEKMQKASDLDMWFSSRRMNTGASSASTSNLSRGISGPDSSSSSTSAQQTGGYRERLAQARGQEASQLPQSRLRTVYGSRRADDDVDAEAAGPSGRRAGKATVRPRRREDDEREDLEFEDDFQDDEEGIGQVGDDALDAEENKELEERIKREMRDINAFGPTEDADEVDDEEMQAQLTKTGRRMKKLLKKRGRRGRPEDDEDDLDDEDEEDDDDDLKNPYASDENEDSDSEDERRRKQQKDGANGRFSATQPPPMSRNGSLNSGPKYPGASSASSAGPSRSASIGPPGSRAASPGASPPNIAKRATSPDSRPGSRAASPTPPPSATKRKAEEGNSPTEVERGAGTTGATKRRKPGSPSPAPAIARAAPSDDSALIAREEIIAFIRDHTPTTKELLKHFKAAMARDARNRDVILQVTKEVAAIVDGRLGLKAGVA